MSDYLPQVIVELGLTPEPVLLASGALILNDAAAGKLNTGVLAGATLWTDISGFLQEVTITRQQTRQQGPLTAYQGGTASITLNNSDARFSPENLAGPYVSGGVTQIRPMIPVRVRAEWAGVIYPLFSGFASAWTPPTADLGVDYDITVVECADLFKVLAGLNLPATGAQGAGELSGARVQRILTAAGWYQNPGASVIAPGVSAMQATTMGDSPLNLLQLTADSEIGEIFADSSGRFVFRDRRGIMTDARSVNVQGVFGDADGTVHGSGTELGYSEVTRPDDDTQLANDVQATIAGGSNVQQVTDGASVAKYLFPRSYVRDDLLLTSDAEALSWAKFVAYVADSDEARFDAVTVLPHGDPDNRYPQVLARELGDRIEVWRRPPGQAAITKECFVRGISHTITLMGWTTVWDLQLADRYSQFLVLDDPTMGQLDHNALSF